MDSVSRVYKATFDMLSGVGLSHYVEPIEHVMEVERLRQAFRPEGDVRFLLLAESHVRMSNNSFASKGAGFVYERRYFTPWWHDLLLPALGRRQPTNPTNRYQWPKRFKSSGFWLLDVSLLSLSGYKKVDKDWDRRPLDTRRKEIIDLAWNGHVKRLLEQLIEQRSRPVICAFEYISRVLPEEIREHTRTLKFRGTGNTRKYANPDYEYGTYAFRKAAEEAKIEGCLLKPLPDESAR
jgi:hypothetical protein